MNPIYISLAQLAYDIVLDTMISGEKDHPGNPWTEKSASYHLSHASDHIDKHAIGDDAEDHLKHALTRIVMAIYREGNKWIYQTEKKYSDC